ncbi:MAG: GTPase ObgE [Endomicrobia bacterium]|nr:GTPase ObgE [Endomicrobiia bacterium]
MFVDVVKIYVESGRGGNGCVSFRREKFVPYGGPDGGRGGKGGDVYLIANPNITTLYDFTLKPHFKASDGEHGKGKNMYGKDGDDLYINVPCGTVIYKLEDNKKIFLKDLVLPNDTLLVAKGGRGGRGNACFKSSTNQAPRVAELGQPGEKVVLVLELKLIADVGIIGLPNVGKSTLLSVLTAAKPKIADYPFTTLSANLGVLQWKEKKLVLADIPGLVEDAHKGKGLGTDFLRHIERTSILLHLLDATLKDSKKIYENFKIVMNELKKYSQSLSKKPMIICLNKVDTLTQIEKGIIEKELNDKFKNKYKLFLISSFNKEGLSELVKNLCRLSEEVKKMRQKCPVENEENAQKKFVISKEIIIEKKGNLFVVKGILVENLVKMTNFSLEESVERLQNVLKKIGVEKALKKNGAKTGDKVLIADVEFEFIE